MTVNQLQLEQVTRINKIFNSYGQKLGISSTQTTDASGTIRFFVKFNPSALYSGFINDQLAEFENVLKPLDSVFSLLTTTIPFVNDYKQYFKELDLDNDPNSITVLDVLGYVAKLEGNSLDVKAIDEIISLGKLINKISAVVNSPDQIQSLGELTIDSLGMIDTANLKKDLKDFSLPEIKLPNSFDIPLLKDSVTTIFDFLKGNDQLTLFSYDAPEFILPQLDLGSIELPVVGIVGGVIYPNIGAKIKLGFGFDTKGISSDNFQAGFFVKDYLGVPEVEVSGGFRVGLFAGIPKVATLNATLDPTLTLGFNIKDPTPNDGKVRLSEIDFSKPFGIFGNPTTSLSLASTANLDIAGASIAKGTTPSIKFDLGGFPPPEIQRQIDKIRGYIDQIQDLKDPSKIVARILTAVGDALNKAGGYIVESLDNLGKFTRKTADKFGNYVEERYENGVKTLQRVWNNAGDYIEDRAEQFGTYTRTKWEGAKSTVSEVVEAFNPFNLDGGAFSLDGGNFIPQGDVVEFQGGKVSSIIKNGQKVLFNTFGNVVNETGVIIGDLVNGIITFRQGVGRSPIDLRPASTSSFSLIDVSVDIANATINQLYVVQQKLAKPTGNIDYRADGSISLKTGNGADILEGTDLSDEFRGGDGNDYIDGKGGNDFIYGEGGDDTLIGGNGRDMLYGGQGSDTLKGGDEVDFLYGEVGNDQFFGGAGNDTIDGGADSDTVRYDDSPSGVNVNIKLGNASDGFGNIDTLINIENITGSNKNDVLIGNASANTINGLGGNDLLIGNGGNDILDGGDDIDTVQYDDDSTRGATVNIDESKGYINTNYAFTLRAFNIAAGKALDGFGGTDTLKNIENIVGSDYDDVLIGNGKDNVITGSKGDDILIGNGGADTLNGGEDKDTLIGGEGIDNLNGGTGDDRLFGGRGNDIIDGGADNDTVHYDDSLSGATVNIDETNYSHTAYPNDLEPSFVIAAGTAGDGFGDTDTLRNLENITGSAYNDVLIGNALKNSLNGLDGNDLLIGNGGDDFLDGGDGTDTVSYRRSVNSANIGVSVDLSISFGFDGIDGIDTLINIENIIGSEFADRLTGNSQANIILGGEGGDIIAGQAGEDRLFGENGRDEIFGGSEDDFLVGGADDDTIDGGANIDTVSYEDSPTGAIVNIDETQSYRNTAYLIDIEPTFSIASGTALDGFGNTDTILNLENIIGSAYNDILIGNALKNTLNGLAGNDLLIGNGGDDILDGGNGTDTVSYRRSPSASGVSVDLSTGVATDGIDGVDTLISIENLIGSQFADRLTGNSQANTILGGDGKDIISGLAGDDRLFGENGDDEIYGGTGNDYLIGGAGADLLDGGDGSDTASYITSTAGVTIDLGNKISFFADASGDRLISIENLEGSEYDDFLYGDENDNTLSGLGGNDIIRGLGGDDKLDGGTGDNILNGGDGNDTIVAADGKNTVYAESGNDSVLLGNGNNTVFAGEGNNSVVVGNGDNTVYANSGNDSIVVGNGNNTVFAGNGKNTITSGSGNDTIYGGAGADVIDAGAGNNTIFAYEGQNIVITLDGNDIIYAGAGRDFISAGGGNDTIFAGDGDNWIDGGTGSNLIYSGNGRNLFILNTGSGFDTIKNFTIGKDKLGLTAGIQPEQLAISQVNSDGFFGTQISIAGSSDVLARIEWTQASQLTPNSFTPNLPSSTSSLISLFG
jgi:Ca2+-binding RTX toxin-like protein